MRPRSTLLAVVLLWVAFYASFALFSPALLDDADSVHAEVAREMLVRHDYVTLYANGVRYLEKAPLMYWAMAASMKVAMVLGAESARGLAAAARVPVALFVLGLALVCEALARRMFRSARAGLYAALILLSSFGVFLFTRTAIPDAGVCLWIACALYCFWRTEEMGRGDERGLRWMCGGFAVACALNVLTKGLIGVVFPVGTALLYLVVTRGWRGAWRRVLELHPVAAVEAFLVVAAPWHVLAGLANPGQGRPAAFHFVGGHWMVPLPTDGNVRGWFWFYFMNEHVLRFLNLRVPHDYDTVPLWLFWGLCFVWLMPWSVFGFHAIGGPVRRWVHALRVRMLTPRRVLDVHAPRIEGPKLLLVLWAALPMVFFSVSTRQEYYCLPALPAMAMLIAGWLALEAGDEFAGSPVEQAGAKAHLEMGAEFRGLKAPAPSARHVSSASEGPSRETGHGQELSRSAFHCNAAVVVVGAVFAAGTVFFLAHTRAPAASTELADLLRQNPADYALSMGHFLDINAQAAGMFRFPLGLAVVGLFVMPLVALVVRRKNAPIANLVLAAGAFVFLAVTWMGLRTFSPVLTSAQLAEAIAPQVRAGDLVAIHGEYESGSTLGFYLKRDDVHILEGRSSNLWYGSFFPDAPAIFETPESFAAKWRGPQRIFLWQSLTEEPNRLPALDGPVYVLAKNGGKEIISNRPNQ